MEALLWDHFDTVHKWIHDKLAKISEDRGFSSIDPGEMSQLLQEAQSAAKSYIDDVGQALKHMLLKNAQNAIGYGLQIFEVFINLVRFFGRSFVWQLDLYKAKQKTKLIQAIRPPPRVNWSRLTRLQVENYANGTGYALSLPPDCFEVIQNTSALQWLKKFFWMSKCTLQQAQLNRNRGETVTIRKEFEPVGQDESAATKKTRHAVEGE